MTFATQPLTLEAFLELPETKPASEFIQGRIIQKPMPQGEHSLLQSTLCETINQVAKTSKQTPRFQSCAEHLVGVLSYPISQYFVGTAFQSPIPDGLLTDF